MENVISQYFRYFHKYHNILHWNHYHNTEEHERLGLADNYVAGRSTWTNNNCESINHVLKQTVQWRHNQLPDLIDKLRTLVNGQYADAYRALCCCGDYALRQEWAKHRMAVDYCNSMSMTTAEDSGSLFSTVRSCQRHQQRWSPLRRRRGEGARTKTAQSRQDDVDRIEGSC